MKNTGISSLEELFTEEAGVPKSELADTEGLDIENPFPGSHLALETSLNLLPA